MKTKLYNWNVNDALKTPEDRAAYIEAAMAENDPEFLTVALGDVAKAEGMSKIARKANVTSVLVARRGMPDFLLPQSDDAGDMTFSNVEDAISYLHANV